MQSPPGSHAPSEPITQGSRASNPQYILRVTSHSPSSSCCKDLVQRKLLGDLSQQDRSTSLHKLPSHSRSQRRPGSTPATLVRLRDPSCLCRDLQRDISIWATGTVYWMQVPRQYSYTVPVPSLSLLQV